MFLYCYRCFAWVAQPLQSKNKMTLTLWLRKIGGRWSKCLRQPTSYPEFDVLITRNEHEQLPGRRRPVCQQLNEACCIEHFMCSGRVENCYIRTSQFKKTILVSKCKEKGDFVYAIICFDQPPFPHDDKMYDIDPKCTFWSVLQRILRKHVEYMYLLLLLYVIVITLM